MPAVGPVSWSPILADASARHSKDLAEHDLDGSVMGHIGTDGSTAVERAMDAGYSRWNWGGENVAAGTGTTTPAAAIAQWLASTCGHCEAMMNANFVEIGVGAYSNPKALYTNYWTLNFGR